MSFLLQKRQLISQPELTLSEIGFGTSSLGGLYRAVSQDQADQVLEAVWQAGIRYFDTAPFYGFGLAEQRLGSFLANKASDSFVVSTKVGRILEPVAPSQIPDFGFVNPLPNEPIFDYSYDGILRSYEQSCQYLQDTPIDILYIHDIGTMTHGHAQNEKYINDLRRGGFKALHSLKSSGAIKAIGLGVNEVAICQELMREVDLDIILLAGRYTLLDRSAEAELIAECAQKHIDLVIGGVFNSGILATGVTDTAYFDYQPASEQICKKVRQLDAACQSKNIPLAAASLQFPLNSSQVSSVLIGTGKVSSLRRSLDLLQVNIPDCLWDNCHIIARSEQHD